MSDHQLPPRRPMPPEVLERLRRRVLPRTRHRVPAAAAAVAALVLGSAALVQVTRDEGAAEPPPRVDTTSSTATTPTTPAGSPRSSVSTPTAHELDACGLTSAEYVVALPPSRLVVAADSFCELAPTGVHRSTPTDRPVRVESGLRLRWVSETGVLVGELPDGAREVTSATNLALLAVGEPNELGAVSHNGSFFVQLEHWTQVALSFDGGPATVTLVPPELFARPTRTEVFTSQRRAEADQVVARCVYRAWLDGAADSPDPARWQPLVATTAQDGDHVVVLRGGSGAVLECPTWGWETGSRLRPEGGQAGRTAFARSGGHSAPGSTTWFLTGVVDERATAVELTDARGRPAAEVVLARGWFAARFTDQLAGERPDFTGHRVRVLAGGEVLHEGPAATG
ncbi:hypothetical protein [Actinosynnema pretiosum]|uniref:Uncharacterized protein n=1 Tax=Actinosynnema pretiosum TaxID=42197 RepID=A0A290ZBG4_9PSEU|nr:hypothetical protein [Actinosynnema pretiosum]ATE56303.1 hypothetical protein CNX65_26035 [Actinosynnema pretiosum]